MQPVGSTQANARAQVDLPAGVMLLNKRARVNRELPRGNAHARVYLQSVGSIRSNAHA